MNLWGVRQPLLGIDLGSSSLKAVRLKPSRRAIRLVYAGLIELPHANGNAGAGGRAVALQSMLWTRDLRRCGSVINLSGRVPLIRYLNLPHMPREELKEAVRWEAKKLISFSLDEAVVDFLVVGEQEERGQRRYEVLLVVAERAMILGEVDEMRRAGFQIVAVDASPLSLLNSIRLNHSQDVNDSLAFIDIGAGKTEINIAKNGILRFTRTVPLAGTHFTATLQKDLGLEYEEAERLKRQWGMNLSGDDISELIPYQRYHVVIQAAVDQMALEIQRSLDYYRAQFRESAIQKIILTGGSSLMPSFSSYLSSFLDIPVAVDDPFEQIVCRNASFGNLRRIGPRFSTSIGLALRNLAR